MIKFDIYNTKKSHEDTFVIEVNDELTSGKLSKGSSKLNVVVKNGLNCWLVGNRSAGLPEPHFCHH